MAAQRRSGGWAHVSTEARKLFVAARDSYLDLQARFPKAMHLREGDREGTVAELVAAELTRA